jgi:transcriptional regulator with XRE-family HTH domain
MEMVMKVNVPLIKRLREEKSWSQEHLAEASGISLRTIQRVETEGNASSETRLALAAALGIDVAQLGASHGNEVGKEPSQPSRLSQAVESFLYHGLTYLLVCSFLMWMDWHQNGRMVWSIYPLMGWGLGLSSHGLRLWLASRRR